MILPIITAPDRRLKVKSEPVHTVDATVRKLMDDMVKTMRAAPGIGLSAIQVGVAKRVVVVEVDEAEPLAAEEAIVPKDKAPKDAAEDAPEDAPGDAKPRTTRYLVNPEIDWSSDKVVFCEEGCLSLPDQYADIERPAEIVVKYLDYDGKPQELKAGGMLARCIQHELDHLDGVLLVDRLSAVRRHMILRKLAKARKLEQPVDA
ncbi:MAG: peptide deformylase [Alphaproteobacteria bacterium]|nr:peptide deformylase [Alphaproteobacteria bacterium]